MGQPDLEEAQLDENELVVLGEITEARYAFRKLDNPLNAGRNSGRELLPQPDLLELETLGHSGGDLSKGGGLLS